MIKKKKGIVQDLNFILVSFFMLMISVGVATLVWYNFNAEIQALDNDIVDVVTKAEIDNMGGIFNFFDKLMPLTFIFLWVLVIIFSIDVVPTHPIFFVISFMFTMLITLTMVVLTDLGTLIFQESIFTPVLDQMSNTIFFANNYHWISFIVMMISLILFFNRAKISRGVGIE